MKIRRIVVGVIAIISMILIVFRVDMPRNFFIITMSIVLINQVIEELHNYKETKRKVHLLIPITAVVFFLFTLFYLIYKFLS